MPTSQWIIATNWGINKAGYFKNLEVFDFLNALNAESNRGAITITISVIDEILKKSVLKILGSGNRESRDRLANPPLGALSTFSARVDFCFCLGILPGDLYRDIKRLNKLRNKCAHGWREFRYTDKIVEDYVAPMACYSWLDEKGLIGQPGGPSVTDMLEHPDSITEKTNAALMLLVVLTNVVLSHANVVVESDNNPGESSD